MTTTHYDANYGNFQTSLYQDIRREAYGEDIGQYSWLTAGQQDKFISWLGLAAGKALLDCAATFSGLRGYWANRFRIAVSALRTVALRAILP